MLRQAGGSELSALAWCVKQEAGAPDLSIQLITYVAQETGDGELVVLHDLHSVLAASAPHAINHDIIAELAEAGLLAAPPATTPTVSKSDSKQQQQ